MKRDYPEHPIIGVGAVIVQAGRVLLVRRDTEPLRGEWSVPGGMLELGEKLRDGVEAALRRLGQAVIEHPESGALREALADGRLDAVGYYRQLLRLVYRVLFLCVAEERRLLFVANHPQAAQQPLAANQAGD